MWMDVCEVVGENGAPPKSMAHRYKPRWKLLGVYVTFVEYLDIIKNHNESQLDQGQMVIILIGLDYHFDGDSAMLI